MHSERTRTGEALAISLLLTLFATPASAGIFDDPENLKVLPEDISAAELRDTMRGFALGLGVRCTHCHVDDPDLPMPEWDFSDDAKETKMIARDMLRMVAVINGEHIAELDRESDERVEVTCVTCHRGQDRPRLLGSHLDEALAEGGVESMTARYEELRTGYHGSHTFDFSEWGILLVAESLAASEQVDAAMALVGLNIQHLAEPVSSHISMANLLTASGDVDAARAQLNHALGYDPENRQALFMLSELGD